MADAADIRRRNLSAVLSRVHHTGGLTRAELTRAIHLNRSTVGDLVATLVNSGWVVESDDAPRESVGRPSPRVTPSNSKLVAAINPELDAVTVALARLGGEIVARRRVTVDSVAVETALAVSRDAVLGLMAEHPESQLMAVGVAVPGLVRQEDGVVRVAPHLGWREEPFGEPLSRSIGVPVAVANDAYLGCRAELMFGAGRGALNVVYLNGGPSGIGGGVVVGGRPVTGSAGYAGELGHLCVQPVDGLQCACGARGCLETLVTRDALVRLLGLDRPDDDELETALIAACSDPKTAVVAAEEVRRQMRVLGIALRGAVNLLNPDRVILGGHLAALLAVSTEADKKHLLVDAFEVSAASAEVTSAALGSQRLLIGAAELAWHSFLNNPLSSPVR